MTFLAMSDLRCGAHVPTLAAAAAHLLCISCTCQSARGMGGWFESESVCEPVLSERLECASVSFLPFCFCSLGALTDLTIS